MDDVEDSCLVEFLVINLTENLDIEYINTNIDYLINLIKLFEYLYNNNNKIYDIYIDKIKSNIEIFNIIYPENKNISPMTPKTSSTGRKRRSHKKYN